MNTLSVEDEKTTNEFYSFIVPVYNTEDYVGRCLDSILNQTYKNLEVICVDDGSTDDSLSILKIYEQKDSRVKVFSQKNSGVSSVRNLGLDKMRFGGSVSFVDSDDWIHPRFLEILDETRSITKADVVACDYKKMEQYIIEDFPKTVIKPEFLSHSDIMKNERVSTKRYIWGKVYSKTILKDRRFVEGLKIGEDTAFNIDVLLRKKDLKFVYIDIPMYYYFYRENSAVHAINNADVIEVVEKAYLKNLEMYGENKYLLVEQSFRTLLGARYLSSIDSAADRCKRCNDLMDRLRIYRCSEISRKKRLMYVFFRRLPWTYRLFRIIDDPTMLKYERAKKGRKVYAKGKKY